MCHTCNATHDLRTWDAPYNPLRRPLLFCVPCGRLWRRTLRPITQGYRNCLVATPPAVPVAPSTIAQLTHRAIRRIEAAYPVRFLRSAS